MAVQKRVRASSSQSVKSAINSFIAKRGFISKPRFFVQQLIQGFIDHKRKRIRRTDARAM